MVLVARAVSAIAISAPCERGKPVLKVFVEKVDVVLVGGYSFHSRVQYLGDTWEFDGVTWQRNRKADLKVARRDLACAAAVSFQAAVDLDLVHLTAVDRDARPVGRHVAPTENPLALLFDDVFDDLLAGGARPASRRQEDLADGVLALLGKLGALRGHFTAQEGVGDLHQQPGAVAGLRIE